MGARMHPLLRDEDDPPVQLEPIDLLLRFEPIIRQIIRRIVCGYDDGEDAFSWVCERLLLDDGRRLRFCDPSRAPEGRIADRLRTVVRRLTIDWIRMRNGRTQRAIPGALSALHRAIFHAMYVDHESLPATYELIRSYKLYADSFTHFLREVRQLQMTVLSRAIHTERRCTRVPLSPDLSVVEDDDGDPAEALSPPVREALLRLKGDDLRAVILFVVQDQSADEVARSLGWTGAKMVYNRVSRALKALRTELRTVPALD
jgi:DNA-directed RNA polymerase specialized sigma24 family protein